ncbi:MAG: methylmalonyl-CoA epimerase [Candidatus Tectomicrobia bacterium]|nr:methylmalonyl-CoA epimerase [Candidatus Tectomicrobia bacterium]
MIKKIDHLGLAVKDLDETVKFYKESFGLDVEKTEDFQGFKIAFIPVGNAELELLQDTNPEGAIAKYIERRGEGIQHVAFEVDNIEEALKEAKAKGITLIDEKPRPGANNTTVGFLHPKSTHGVLIEFVKRPSHD